MQILEVKSDIAKITYNPVDNRLLPSDFLLIEDSNQKLIAQVIDIETTDKSDENLAILRLALSIDKDDNLSYFNGYIPAKTSKLIYITPEEIIELVEGSDKNIYLGNLSNHSSCFVKTSISYVDDRLYIQSDRNDKTQIVVQNLVSELRNKNKKVVIIDFNGQYSSASDDLKLKISENIKLPLNIEAFDTILQYDTIDCPIEDKAVIQSIVLELREYMQTLKDKFIPFDMFKNVVSAEFESNPVSGLMLLRNKLWMYAQDGIFANKKEEFDVIDSTFFNQNIIIVDASDIEEKWFKFVIQTVLQLTNHESYLFLSLNDIQIDKKSIVSLYNKPNIVPVVSTSYDNPYRTILKSLCKNHLLCKPSVFLNEQEYYSPLLNRMNIGDFIAYGETTLNLPLIIELQQFSATTAEDVTQNEIKRDVDKLLSSPQTVIPKTNGIVQDDLIDSLQDVEPIDDLNDIQDIEELEEFEQGEIVIDDVHSNDDEVAVSDEKYENNPSPEDEKLLDFEQEPVPDDEFKDSDFEFLDEVSTSEESDDDILNVPFELSFDNQNGPAPMLAGSGYGIFNPLPEDLNENSTFIEKISADSADIVEDVEQINVDDNLDDLLSDIPVIDVSSNQESSAEPKKASEIKKLPDDILIEDVETDTSADIQPVDSIDVISDDLEIISDVSDDIVEDNLEIIPEKSEIQLIDDVDVSNNDNISSVEQVQVDNLLDEDIIIDSEMDQTVKVDEVPNIESDVQEVAVDSELSSIDDVITDITTKMEEDSQKQDNQDELSSEEPQAQTNDVNLDDLMSEDNDEVVPQQSISVQKEVPPPIKQDIVSREQPKNVPVYETDIPDDTSTAGIPFQVGDRVYHPKHGNGVIEAFSSYSNRILFCHILFDNVGRKIMDPRVSCIEKVS